MGCSRLANDRKAKPGPIGAAGHERLEQMIADVRWRSCTAIVDRQNQAFRFALAATRIRLPAGAAWIAFRTRLSRARRI
jgi:hypothetical protein